MESTYLYCSIGATLHLQKVQARRVGKFVSKFADADSVAAAAMPTSLGGGLNNMLMHLSQLLADNCTLELSQIRLNTGDQFFRRSARRSHPTRTAGQALDRMSAWVRRPTRRGAADARGIRSVRFTSDTSRARPRLARVRARPPRRRRAAVGAASAREHQS